jgi:hypothetical protein
MTPTQLPLFEGLPTLATRLSLSGTIDAVTDQPDRALNLHEEIFLLVRGRVDRVTLDADDADGTPAALRGHRYRVTQAFELDAELASSTMIELARGVAERVGLTDLPEEVRVAVGSAA